MKAKRRLLKLGNSMGSAVYKKIIIYYFSGTGNSRNVVTWMSEVAKEFNVEATVNDIVNCERLNPVKPEEDTLVVFCSPVHGFNYPPIMLNFIRRFPKGKNDVLLMNTRGGMKIGKWVTPGLTGAAFYLSGLFLRIKGYRIRGMFPVDLPSNWQSLHPALNQNTINYLHEKNRERVTTFARKFYSGEKYFKSLRSLPFDLIVAPISLAYYFIGRFFLAKTFYASGDCDNCGVCIKNCPVKAIIRVNERPFWTFNCESCMRCMGNCPKRAIETGHGYLALVLFLFYAFLFPPIIQKFYTHFEFGIADPLIKELIQAGIFLCFFAMIYRIIHYLKQIRVFERIIVFSSLTKYKFWGKRYKALR
ncbi:MAG: EFR1 family ferrodoxin [Ignavibacteriaceae bacterium]